MPVLGHCILNNDIPTGRITLLQEPHAEKQDGSPKQDVCRVCVFFAFVWYNSKETS